MLTLVYESIYLSVIWNIKKVGAMIYLYRDKKYDFLRYPKTRNRSLRAWSAIDEYMIKYLDDQALDNPTIMLYNDRFGVLQALLNSYAPYNVCAFKSQEKAITKNLEINRLSLENRNFIHPLSDEFPHPDVALIKIPKTLELFDFYLYHLSQQIKDSTTVIGGFMTRHFSPQILKIAEKYFEEVKQSRAWKKSRLLFLRNPKEIDDKSFVSEFKINEAIIRHYPGVFSANKIDAATDFLLSHIDLTPRDRKILDLGCGNGIISLLLSQENKKAEFHLIDDYYLAIESAKLNLKGDQFHFYYDDNLKKFDNRSFDLVVSNPPFHFDHENNIEVSLELFQHVERILKNEGHFKLVANKHLNYFTHLEKYFDEVLTIRETDKYVLYDCIKRMSIEDEQTDDVQFNI